MYRAIEEKLFELSQQFIVSIRILEKEFDMMKNKQAKTNSCVTLCAQELSCQVKRLEQLTKNLHKLPFVGIQLEAIQFLNLLCS